MLTHDQTRIRQLDSKILQLEKDNDRLRDKCVALAGGFCDFADEIVSKTSFSKRKELMDLASQLRAMKKEDF